VARVPSTIRPPPPPAAGTQKARPEAKAPEKKGLAQPQEKAWTPASEAAASDRGEKAQEGSAQQSAASEHADEAQAKEQGKEVREQSDKSAQLKQAQAKPGEKAQAGKQAGAQQAQKQQGAQQTKAGFERLGMTSTSYSQLNAVGQVQNKLTGSLLKQDRPPDAFALLKEAKEKGVLFQEDSQREGHSEEDEDPALAEAVEEAIRQLFGVRGILRIGPGRNEANEAVVVVVAAQGFGEASFARVPADVNGFATLVAIPFDILPLRKDR